jgi:hypothetical protein
VNHHLSRCPAAPDSSVISGLMPRVPALQAMKALTLAQLPTLTHL